ncbi:type I DNA topoisomerase [Paludicola sp. MB14-C6]|uniref:type I DNA topoisomerase n=1 Tax=Paludihabitans sp. MB14-C6 TaxID=3070656 RepID=UPI0027DDF333|nr:type I DNA topoisomerase [Paludicola sp. MB14-C6]WMJ23688.1 type I DNA topoisomerase [Paludicola sp. MB14-C6]
MAKNLVIVESPAKAKTIKKYLGKDYEVIASMGHVRDLPKSKLGIDVDNNFEPKYINIRKQSETIKKLKASAKGKAKIYLATDPDREGEAISWHLAHLLKVDLDQKNRVTFNEITKTGVKSGMKAPRKIDLSLVDSQQARRILDRIVGYKLSPFLWKKVRSGLSAGRVQSVTVRLIVDREEEINNFKEEEYWSIEAELLTDSSKKPFVARFYGKDGKKVDIHTESQTNEILAVIKNADFVVQSVKKGVRKKSPAPPFTTSTMQQEASRKLGFQARRTMKAAQELYEGIDVENIGAVGLITYMRTDSLRISDEARTAAYEYIENQYGKEYIPSTPRIYKSKNNAQDAHEAIRPSLPEITPLMAKSSLTSDQYKLYKLIWERFIASQMAGALFDTVSAQIDANSYTFKASGFTVKFDGFTKLYVEGKDDESQEEGILPELNEKEILTLNSINGNQHFTQPPPRYTEASLIKVLEENGIGRPSTYAPTITTILSRNYVERDGKQLKPTELGFVTTKLMKEQFNHIVDVDFTANMEKDLDVVEEGKTEWQTIIRNFYTDFEKDLEKAEVNTEGQSFKVADEETDVICENCGRNMVIKMGRFGKFLACPGYPECKNTKKIVNETHGFCPKCGGKILEKKSKKGKKFYGCEKYPECSFLSWDAPTSELCPKCGKTLLKKAGKTGKLYCSNEECDFEKGLKE